MLLVTIQLDLIFLPETATSNFKTEMLLLSKVILDTQTYRRKLLRLKSNIR